VIYTHCQYRQNIKSKNDMGVKFILQPWFWMALKVMQQILKVLLRNTFKIFLGLDLSAKRCKSM
jgi:hypothetical protein